MIRHRFRSWLGTEQATSHNLKPIMVYFTDACMRYWAAYVWPQYFNSNYLRNKLSIYHNLQQGTTQKNNYRRRRTMLRVHIDHINHIINSWSTIYFWCIVWEQRTLIYTIFCHHRAHWWLDSIRYWMYLQAVQPVNQKLCHKLIAYLIILTEYL